MKQQGLSRELTKFVKAVREALEACETHCQHLPYQHIEYAEFKDRFECVVDDFIHEKQGGGAA